MLYWFYCSFRKPHESKTSRYFMDKLLLFVCEFLSSVITLANLSCPPEFSNRVSISSWPWDLLHFFWRLDSIPALYNNTACCLFQYLIHLWSKTLQQEWRLISCKEYISLLLRCVLELFLRSNGRSDLSTLFGITNALSAIPLRLPNTPYAYLSWKREVTRPLQSSQGNRTL